MNKTNVDLKIKYIFVYTILLILSIAFGYININAKDLYNTENYYTEQYKIFMDTQFEDEIELSKTAILYDFDNDDFDEMLTFYVSDDHMDQFSTTYHYEIFDMNNSTTKFKYTDTCGPNVNIYGTELIYVCDKDYIIHRTYELGYAYHIIEYNGRELNLIDEIAYMDPYPDKTYFYNLADWEIDGDTFNLLYEKYGINNVEKILMPDNDIPYTRNNDDAPIFTYDFDMVMSSDKEKIENLGDDYKRVVVFEIGSNEYVVNGECFRNDVVPIVENGRTIVPVRVVSESLGADVEWIQKSNQVVLKKDGKEICIKINKPLENNMGEAKIINNRIYVPIRYIAEELGAVVTYDEQLKLIQIYQ